MWGYCLTRRKGLIISSEVQFKTEWSHCFGPLINMGNHSRSICWSETATSWARKQEETRIPHHFGGHAFSDVKTSHWTPPRKLSATFKNGIILSTKPLARGTLGDTVCIQTTLVDREAKVTEVKLKLVEVIISCRLLHSSWKGGKQLVANFPGCSLITMIHGVFFTKQETWLGVHHNFELSLSQCHKRHSILFNVSHLHEIQCSLDFFSEAQRERQSAHRF